MVTDWRRKSKLPFDIMATPRGPRRPLDWDLDDRIVLALNVLFTGCGSYLEGERDRCSLFAIHSPELALF
jgi:hypothetical protein